MNKFDAIQYFCIAAETQNFRETANRLAISPSVITRVINELEAQLGEQLFKRNTRNIKLTAFGEAFLPKAEQWLKDSERLFIKAKEQDEMAGIVRITVPAWRHNDLILKALFEATAPYPDLIIDWRDDMNKLDLVEHRIDMGLRIGLEPNHDFIVRTITQIGDVLVARPNLIAELGPPQDLEDFAQRYPFVAPINPATGRPWHLQLNPEQALLPRRINFYHSEPYSGLQAILSGKSAGLVSDFIAKPYLESGELQQLLPQIPIQKWQLFLYRPYQTVTSTRVLRVFDLMTEILHRVFRPG
ncbi:LysR family transcriptional regulator [Pasteurellaceae bacterium RH1A]|nr:LysR family transcriptional regulator [Pasteurellaceae bacterium RH1A]